MAEPVPNPFESMSMEELAAHIRKERFSCRSLHMVFALAKGVRRAALLSIDPAYPDDLIEFDDELDKACRQLSKVVQLLCTIRERVDKKRIEAERAQRACGYAITAGRRAALEGAQPRRIATGYSAIEQRRRMKAAMDKLDPAQVLQLLKEIKEGLDS